MQIQIASDLHLEFPVNAKFLETNPLLPVADILLLAGDIVPLINIERHKDFFKFLSDHFEHTYWVPGNHEYYNFDMANRSGAFIEHVRSNVTLLNNHSVDLPGLRLHFTTLWSYISKERVWDIEGSMNDFYEIRFEGKQLNAAQYNFMHQESVSYLQSAFSVLSDNPIDVKNIVITHHVPTMLNYPAKYVGSPLNEAFATNMNEFIERSAAEYWIYGHHHAAVSPFLLGNTKMVTNQLGYVSRHENLNFQSGFTIEL